MATVGIDHSRLVNVPPGEAEGALPGKPDRRAGEREDTRRDARVAEIATEERHRRRKPEKRRDHGSPRVEGTAGFDCHPPGSVRRRHRDPTPVCTTGPYGCCFCIHSRMCLK